ncbi:MAG: GDP-mannose 4,6-dehydratase [Candidatus Hodarchaeota archaeon]
MKDKQALVTGGAGFIGSHLVDSLLKKGANVTVLDDLSSGNRSNVNYDAHFIQGDIRDFNTVKNCISNMDIVYHLAADTTTRESSMGWYNPSLDLQINVEGSLNIFKAIIEQDLDTYVIFTSSAAVYGEPIYVPMDEDHPTNPISPYGISKLSVEKYAFAYFKEYGINSISIRIFNTYGPRQQRYVIFDLLKKLQINRYKLEVLGNGDTIRDYSYVSDTVNALLLLTEKCRWGNVYNISGENPISIKELIFLILSELNLNGITEVYYTGKSWKGDIKKMIADNKRIKELGFKPKITLKKGINKTIKWFYK